MKKETKFKIVTFLKYLIIEPWVTKFSLPNITTISWIFVLVAILIRNINLIWISIIFGVAIYLFKQYKSGAHICWYRQTKFNEFLLAKRKVRELKKQKDL